MGRRRALHAGITIATTLALLGLWVPAAAAKPSKPATDDFQNATPITTPRFTDSIDTSKAKAAKDDPTRLRAHQQLCMVRPDGTDADARRHGHPGK
jgi:hypothetical protein